MHKLLLIEGNPDARNVIIHGLRQEFPELQVEQVIELGCFSRALIAGNFDLVITDYQLHWSDGLAILHQIKERYPNCPVIMFTGSANQEIAVEAMKAGLEDYIIKSPKNFVRLSGAVLSALKRVESQQRANRAEARLQSLLNRLDMGFFRSTLEGRLLEGNASFLRLLGVSSLEEAQSLYSSQFREIEVTLPGLNQKSEVQLHRENGSSVRVLLNQTFIHTEAEPVIEGLIEEIGDRKQAESVVFQALAKERELSELKSRIITTVSHEYRTPLTTITMSADLLKNYGHKWSQQKQLTHLCRISNAAQYLGALVNEMLTLTDAEAGKVQFKPEKLNLLQFCQEVVREISLSTNSSCPDITFSSLGNCTDAYVDKRLLRQILTNLLSNAIKYSPQGGTVRFNLECQDGTATIRVQDDGIGIPEADLSQLFESFYRASNVGILPGTGLGLAIVKKYVDLHQGQIRVESVVNVGTTFTVTLPLNYER